MKIIKTYSATLLVVLLMTMTGCPRPYDGSDYPLFAKGYYFAGPIVPPEGECWKLEDMSISYNFGNFTCQLGSETRISQGRRANLFFPSHKAPLPDTALAASMLAHCEAKAMKLFEACNAEMDNLMDTFGAGPACKTEIDKQRDDCVAEFENAKKRCQYECSYVKKKALETQSNSQ